MKVLLMVLDPTWVDHGHRVRRMAGELGRRLGVRGDAYERLEISALLHDIGKARIDPAVLALPRSLTRGEWEHVQQHPRMGFDMLNGNVHDDIAAAVLAHHEWYDGSGYPQRTPGPETPLAARILAVADAYDAIVSDRVYDPARPVSSAIAEIAAGSGTQFDALVVEAFCDVMAPSITTPVLLGGVRHRRGRFGPDLGRTAAQSCTLESGCGSALRLSTRERMAASDLHG